METDERGTSPKRELILDVKDLRTYFYTEDGVVEAVDGIDLQVKRGEVLGLVGESGCGKSVSSFSIMRLVGVPGKIVSGEIWFDGQNIINLSAAEMGSIRGNRISMIFQQPVSCLNPVFRAGDQIAEVLQIHQNLDKKAAWEKTIELMSLVKIPEPEKRARAFPHELSGGMAQRIMIAMALACSPELLIADEPTTALDVTIQAQILELMSDLRSKFDTAIILITHDMGIIAEMADRVAVMYAGRIVEQTDVKSLFANPLHPYTRALLASIPILGVVQHRLAVIPGVVPNLIGLPECCTFAPRCEARVASGFIRCTQEEPPLTAVEPGHQVRCWLY